MVHYPLDYNAIDHREQTLQLSNETNEAKLFPFCEWSHDCDII